MWYVERDHVCSKCWKTWTDKGLEYVGGVKAFLAYEGVHSKNPRVAAAALHKEMQ
jgi:hypothetical protein